MKPDKRLADTKVYVAGKSKEIQEKVFRLGYEWNLTGTEIRCTEIPFLYFDKNGIVTDGCDMNYFMAHPYRGVTADYILSLEPEPECPFKPFDKVLVRDGNSQIWLPKFFGFYDDGIVYPYSTIDGADYMQCIPYEGNEHLAFTTDSPKQ